MRVFRIVRSILFTIGAVVGAGSILLVIATLAFGLRPLVVISGSMEPGIPTGSLILTRTVPAADLKIGDVVTVPRPDGRGPVTHRVVEIDEMEQGPVELELQGDANAAKDPQPYVVNEAGLLQLTVPGLGVVVEGLRSPLGLAGVGTVLVGLVLLYFVQPARPTAKAKRTRAVAADPATHVPARPLSGPDGSETNR
ncbi:signal peptidase I [Leucobacter sp. NPDC077196]|uniref:signal peptidase I n=1 Tax=Leucobacter sp. NPDC077196 TaxID=3154959 RepID=UPI003437BDD3